jgi:hypothetical protein
MELPAMSGMIKRVAWGLLLPLLLSIASHGQADAGSPSSPKPDVRLLIDISGSMRDSDPDNLRAPALDLIVRLLPEGSKAGVWIFGEDVEELIAHRLVDDDWRRWAQSEVSAITNAGLRTNIPEALAAATYDFEQMNPSYRTSIILLTDGKVDVAESPMVNAAAARKVLTEVAPELGATGVPVHTIALSDEADWTFLRTLAQNTGGIAEKAETPEQLTKIFLQALEMVAPTARVPVAGSSFQIDGSVEEFTALVFYEQEGTQVALVSPSGTEYRQGKTVQGVDWFSNRKFALVTVKGPQPGKWRLVAPKGSTFRVTVISDLQLEVDPLPNNLPAGRIAELGLRLREKGRVITDPEVLSLFSISVSISGPRGEVAAIDVSADYPVPSDGEFRVVVPAFEDPGRYQVLARVDGRTLQRELPMYVEVAETEDRSAIVTRGAEIPEDDLKQPLIGLAVGILLIIAIILAILRRRKRRKIEQWQRRSRESVNNEESGIFQGLSAEDMGTEEDKKP